VIRLVSQIITRAINNGASDIHFEPEERLMRIRNAHRRRLGSGRFDSQSHAVGGDHPHEDPG
jgi:hypothetical protein